MKKFECYDCDGVFEAETQKEILDILYTHYMEKHKEIITGNTKEEKEAWMIKFEKDWKAAPSV